MNQINFFNSGENNLSYACGLPNSKKIKAGLIFIHAADGNRIGPHRMFVELAETLKHNGIASFRFDMKGCGDSSGEPAKNNIDHDIENLLSAINFFITRYKMPKIFLFGISRGSRVIFSTLAENSVPINGAILLSTPFPSPKAAAKKFTNRVKEYLYKFKNPQTLKKLLSGKANPKQILKTLAFALNSQKRYRRNSHGFKTTSPLFFIYGSKDPIASDSKAYYTQICQKYKIRHKITEIKNANHSFFHYRWKEQIIEISEKWLTENMHGEKHDTLP